MLIGDRIKAQRQLRGWTQEQLAAFSGISVGYIRLLEQNRRPNPRMETLQKLASALRIGVSELVEAAHGTGTLHPIPLAELRALGRSEDDLRELAENWAYYSAAERLDLIRMAQDLYKGQQDLDRRRSEQQEAINALLRRRKPAP